MALALTAPLSAAEEPVVRGQASYRERIALPPAAVFEATLEDVSRAGAKAEVLGRVRLQNPGQVPIHFEVPNDPAKIDDRYSYAVRARILRGERLLFTTDRSTQCSPAVTGTRWRCCWCACARPGDSTLLKRDEPQTASVTGRDGTSVDCTAGIGTTRK